MEADYGVISDPGVTIFVVTDGVADITPASSSVTLASVITYAGTQARVEDAREEEAFVPGESAFCLPDETQVSSDARGDDRYCKPFPENCCLSSPSMTPP